MDKSRELTQEQQNKAMVAEFMGMVPVYCSISNCNKRKVNTGECDFDFCGHSDTLMFCYGENRWSHCDINQLDYDTNWNSLISACKVWDDLLYIEGKEREQMRLSDDLDNAVTIYEIDAAYRKLLKNINWYNLNDPSKQADSLCS